MNQEKIRTRASAVAFAAFLALGGLHLSTSTARAQEGEASEKAPTKWAVVRVNEEIKVMPSDDVRALRTQLDAAWKDAVKRHQEARKRAAKEKQEFNEEKPDKPVIKVLKDGLKTEDAANEAREAFEARGKKSGGGSASNARGAFVVVKVGEEHRVVAETELKDLKQSVADADKQALKSFEEAKKAAKKAKEPFTQQKPGRTKVAVVKKFSSKEEAEDYAKKAGESKSDG